MYVLQVYGIYRELSLQVMKYKYNDISSDFIG